jgi:DNA-binding transcriptional regulator of glucitol operon
MSTSQAVIIVIIIIIIIIILIGYLSTCRFNSASTH